MVALLPLVLAFPLAAGFAAGFAFDADFAVDFVVDFALLCEERLGAVLEFAQDERRNLWRRELAVAKTDADDSADVAADAER